MRLPAALTTTWALTSATLRQYWRDPTSLFFAIALPIGIIVIIGSTFGGTQDLEIGVVSEGAEPGLVMSVSEQLDDDVEVVAFDDVDAARRAIRRFDIEAAVVIDETGSLGLISDTTSGSVSFTARGLVEQAIDRATAPPNAERPDVTVTTLGADDVDFASDSDFSLTAAQNLVLFTFITSLTAGVLVVRARRLGVLRRAATTAASPGALSTGLAGAWFVLAMVQAAIILLVGSLAFGVDWGDRLAGLALLVLFGLVGSGAGLLVGGLFENEDQVGSAGPPFALVLGALGGCMVPTEVFPDSMVTVSRFTPHYWALEGWKDLIFDGAGLSDVGTNLLVLAAMATVLLGAASVAVHRSVLRPPAT